MEISHTWNFGDDKELADTLKKFVLSGKKTATTGLYREGQRVPGIGEYATIMDSEGNRFCVIQYINVEVKPFLEVDYNFIQKEGEDDKSVEEWREKHRKFFGLKDDKVKVICEEFEMIIQVQE